MAEERKPKSIVVATKTTQEIVVDKEALARWLQDLVERNFIAHGITKQEIEKGFCRYHLHYEQLAMLGETMMQNAIDRGQIKGYSDIHITGSGKDVGFSITTDMAVPPPGMGVLRVVNGPEKAVAPLDPKSALNKMKESISLDMNGFAVDAEKLVGGLQSLAQFFQASANQLQNQLKAMSPQEKQEFMEHVVDHIRPQFQKAGIELGKIEGSKIEIKFRYEKLLELAEKHGGTDRGYVIKRGGDGTGSVLIDYRRIVDLAVEKAQALIAKRKSDGAFQILPVDGDNVKLVISKDGDGSNINKILDGVVDKIVQMSEPYRGGMRQAYGTLDNPKTPDQGLPPH